MNFDNDYPPIYPCDTYIKMSCVSSGGCCRWSGHEIQSKNSDYYVMGNVIGFVFIPIFLTILSYRLWKGLS